MLKKVDVAEKALELERLLSSRRASAVLTGAGCKSGTLRRSDTAVMNCAGARPSPPAATAISKNVQYLAEGSSSVVR